MRYTFFNDESKELYEIFAKFRDNKVLIRSNNRHIEALRLSDNDESDKINKLKLKNIKLMEDIKMVHKLISVLDPIEQKFVRLKFFEMKNVDVVFEEVFNLSITNLNKRKAYCRIFNEHIFNKLANLEGVNND